MFFFLNLVTAKMYLAIFSPGINNKWITHLVHLQNLPKN